MYKLCDVSKNTQQNIRYLLQPFIECRFAASTLLKNRESILAQIVMNVCMCMLDTVVHHTIYTCIDYLLEHDTREQCCDLGRLKFVEYVLED